MKKIAKKIIAIMCVLSLVSALMPVASKSLNTVEASGNEYTELTFQDFGIEDTTFEGGTSGVIGTAPATVTSLDKVIISGKIKVTSHIDEHFLIGGAADAGDYNASTPGLVLSTLGTDRLMIRWQYNGQKGAEYYPFNNPTLTSKGINLVGDEIILKLQFDYVGEDVNVTLTLDNGTVNASETVTFSGIASKLTTNLAFNPWLSKCSIASVKYTELTFDDFGIEDTAFEGGTTGVKGTAPTEVTSFNKVRFSGKIKVNSHVDEHFMFGGATEAGDYYAATPGIILSTYGQEGLLIRWQYENVKGAEYILFTEPNLAAQGIDLTGDELLLEVQFDYAGEDVNVTVTLDNGTTSASQKVTFAGIASQLTTNMAFNPWLSNCEIASVGGSEEPGPGPGTDPEPGPEKTYTQLTFSDFGIASQVFGGGTTGVLGTVPAEVTSLDGIIFSGQIKISYHLDEHFLIGGADDALDYNAASPGIILSQASDGMLIIRSQFDGVKGAEYILFDEKTPVSQGFNMLEDVIAFDMQFDYQGDDVTVTVTMDNGTVSVTDSATLSGIASKLSTNVIFNPWLSACKIASIGEDINGEGGSEEEPDEVTEFTELTFNSFRIKDNDYLNNIIYGTPLSYVKDFDKVAFSGYVVLAEESSSVRIACGENSLEGLMLAYDAAGKQLILSDQSGAGRGDIFKVTEEEADIKFVENEFKFRLTFDFYGDGNVRLRMYINDTLYGKTTLPMYSSYLKNNVILLAGTHIAVRSIEGAEEYELTPWEEFIRSKVIFEYFGFTDNWDKEMDEGI